MAKQTTTSPFRTVAGSYEAPVEGIVDYGAFRRGFEKGLGDLSKIKQKDKDQKVDPYSIAEFNVDKGNNFTGGEPIYKDEGGVLLQSEWAKTNNPTYRKGDREKKQQLEQNVGQMNIYTNHKGLVWNALGDEQVYDSNFNPPIIDENLEKIEGVTWEDVNRVHKKYAASQNRSAGFKEVIRDGKVIGEKSGEFMTVNGRDIFINYEDMDKEWIAANFKLNYSHENSLSTNKPKGFENKVNAGQMLEKTYDQQTIVNGKVIESGSTTNIISDDWYIDTESKINLAGEEVFNFDQGVMGNGYSSAFRNFMDQDFELSPETIQKFKKQGLDITNANQLKSFSESGLDLTKTEKVNMLRDWWTQSSLITTASIGYDRDVDQQLERKDYTDNEISDGFAVRGDKTIKLFEKDGKLFKKGTNRAERNPIKIDTRYKVKPGNVEEEETVSGFGFGSTPGLSDASRILAQINFNQSGAKGASLSYFKGIEVKGGTIINPRIVREGKNKFLVYDTRSSSGSVAKYGKEENDRFPEQRFNLSDTEDRTRLARLKALTLTGADEGTDATIETLPQAIKLRTDTQDVFGFYSLQNREKLITGQSKYANAILTPGWKSWWNTNKGNYNQVPDNKTEQIKRSENILKDFNLSIN